MTEQELAAKRQEVLNLEDNIQSIQAQLKSLVDAVRAKGEDLARSEAIFAEEQRIKAEEKALAPSNVFEFVEKMFRDNPTTIFDFTNDIVPQALASGLPFKYDPAQPEIIPERRVQKLNSFCRKLLNTGRLIQPVKTGAKAGEHPEHIRGKYMVNQSYYGQPTSAPPRRALAPVVALPTPRERDLIQPHFRQALSSLDPRTKEFEENNLSQALALEFIVDSKRDFVTCDDLKVEFGRRMREPALKSYHVMEYTFFALAKDVNGAFDVYVKHGGQTSSVNDPDTKWAFVKLGRNPPPGFFPVSRGEVVVPEYPYVGKTLRPAPAAHP